MWELTKSYKMAVIRIISRSFISPETLRYQDTAPQVTDKVVGTVVDSLRHLVMASG